MRRLKLLFASVSIVLLLTSCASAFKNINPENQEFSHRIETNTLSLEYNPDILRHSRNSKFQRKANRKDVGFIVGKFTNKSADSIHLGKDVTFNLEKRSTKETYSKLKQSPLIYYLALVSVGVSFSSREGTNAFIGFNPFGLIYALPNSIVAAVANTKMKKELSKYDLENKVIGPNESTYGLLTYNNLYTPTLKIETVKGVKVDSKTHASRYGSLLVEQCMAYDQKAYSSYEEYRKSFIQCLQSSKLVRSVTTFDRKYKNGNPKVIGINAKHNLEKSSNYLYKVGTWAYYNEDGTVEKFVEYGINGQGTK